MRERPNRQDDDSDPLMWCVLIALAFGALAAIRLTVPSITFFDEVHYVNAARRLLDGLAANREHPMFAKEVISGSIWLLGDRPFAWRVPSLVFGTAGLFAFSRLMWALSHDRIATVLGAILLASNFMWLVQSRIAMLDIYAAALIMSGLWQFAAAMNDGARRQRMRLAAAGITLGLAMGAKWSAVPYALLPGLAFVLFWLKRRAPVSLMEAGLWLGLLPLAVYWLTYLPAFVQQGYPGPLDPFQPLAVHREMIALQDSVTQEHTYQSRWWQWTLDLRPVWYLYEQVNGAWRGVLLLGNPVTMWAGLPAFVWCLWAAARQRRRDAAAMAILFTVGLALWIVAAKPIQFYYHYLLPGAFLAGALALGLAEIWRCSIVWRIAAASLTGLAIGVFVLFFPILSAAPLEKGQMAFERWMWLDSWR